MNIYNKLYIRSKRNIHLSNTFYNYTFTRNSSDNSLESYIININ